MPYIKILMKDKTPRRMMTDVIGKVSKVYLIEYPQPNGSSVLFLRDQSVAEKNDAAKSSKDFVATSSTEAEYVAGASCYAQVLWIQNQMLDYGYIEYALTVNPTIYVSCIKQLWNTVAIKQSNDVTRLQALVDKKKVVVTEAAIRDVLHLDDAEGIDRLPNEEIFTELARMGYEKPSTKLTFYMAFFSS
nr:ribonuclease H-like domain, reverse transcriptase, RNA-dependent DNA polymerase [Tanacetum cinerariifolium]